MTTIDPAVPRRVPGAIHLEANPDSVFLDLRLDGNTLYGTNTQSRIERALLPQGPDSFFSRETGSEWSFERNATTREVETLIRWSVPTGPGWSGSGPEPILHAPLYDGTA